MAASRQLPEDAPGAKPPPPLVMLDPGHGGKDPGAIGVSGTYEKQVSLATALELKRQLEASGRYRVELTRGTTCSFRWMIGSIGRSGVVRRCSYRCMPMRCRIIRCAGRQSIPWRRRRRMRRPQPWRGRRTAPTGLSAANGRGHRPRFHASLPAWCGRKPARLGANRPQPGRQPGSGSADAAEPRSARRIRRAEGRGYPKRAGGDGVHVQRRDEAALRQPDHRKLVAQAMRRAVDAYFAGTGHMADKG